MFLLKITAWYVTRSSLIKQFGRLYLMCAQQRWPASVAVHRALCCLFRPDTDGTRVSKCGQLSQQTRRLDPMLFQCWSSAVGGGPILKQHWVKCSRLLGSTQVSVYTHPSATIIFSPADQGTFSKTAGQSQAYYNTWNWRQPSAHFNMRRSSVQGEQCTVAAGIGTQYLWHMN